MESDEEGGFMQDVRDDIDKFMEEERTPEYEDQLSKMEGGFDGESLEEEEGVQIYTDEPGNKGFFKGNFEQYKEGDMGEGEDIMLGEEIRTRDNEKTLQNNYLEQESVNKHTLNAETNKIETPHETSHSQRTEVKIPGMRSPVDMWKGGSQRDMVQTYKVEYETKKKFGTGGSGTRVSVRPGDRQTIQAFGEVMSEKPLFKNNKLVLPERTIKYMDNAAKQREIGSEVRCVQEPVKYNKKGTDTFMNYVDMNNFGSVSMNEKSYEKYHEDYVRGSTHKQEENEGFKMRIRKGRTLNVYRKEMGNEQEKTSRRSVHPQSKMSRIEMGNPFMSVDVKSHLGRLVDTVEGLYETSNKGSLIKGDDMFGSANLTENSETIVRVRPGNSVSMKQTRGGVDELRDYIKRGKRDSIGRTIGEGRGVIHFERKTGNIRTQSESKNWRKTTGIGRGRRHWELGEEMEVKNQRRTTTSTEVKSLSRIMSSLNRHHLYIIKNNEKKQKDIMESEKKRKYILELSENEKREREREREKRREYSQPLQPQIYARNNRISFGNSQERLLNSFGPRHNRESMRMAHNNPYGEYYEKEAQTREYPGYQKEVKTFQGEPRMFYQKANVDSRKRIPNLNEYYTDIFERSRQRNERSQELSKRSTNTMGYSNVFNSTNFRDTISENEKKYYYVRGGDTEPRYSARDSNFSGNKYMSTISMNNEHRVSSGWQRDEVRDYDVERYIKKFSSARNQIQERLSTLGPYKEVDARSHLKKNPKNGTSQEYSFRDTYGLGRSEFSRKTLAFQSFRNNDSELYKGSIPKRSRKQSMSKPIEPKVTRRVLPKRELKDMKMNSRGNLVKMPLAKKLKKILNINHFDKKRKGKQTALSYGVKGHIRMRESSAQKKKH
jgi:hypothetical protein